MICTTDIPPPAIIERSDRLSLENLSYFDEDADWFAVSVGREVGDVTWLKVQRWTRNDILIFTREKREWSCRAYPAPTSR